MSVIMLNAARPRPARPRPARAQPSGRPARSASVAPHVLAACVLDGRNPRRPRPRLRTLRIVVLAAAVAFCAAFWVAVTQLVLHLAG